MSLSYFPLTEVHYRTGLHLTPSYYFLPLSDYIPTASQKLISLPESHSDLAFIRSLSVLIPPNLFTCLTFIHLTPYAFVNLDFQSTGFFPILLFFQFSSVLPLLVLCLEHLIHQLSHLPVF